jgi:hypothetical protein
MATVTLPFPSLVDHRPPSTPAADAAFEKRWDAWQTRGWKHDRRVRRRATLTAVAAAIVAIGAAIVYGLLAS